jgi:hypothetical protein
LGAENPDSPAKAIALTKAGKIDGYGFFYSATATFFQTPKNHLLLDRRPEF